MSAIDAHSTSPAPSVLRRIARRVLRRASTDAATAEVAIIKQSGMFDTEWYLKRYPDVASAGMDPVEHYVRHGAAEGRNPSAEFDTGFYTKRYPDVVATGMNPFRHYVEFGHKERRAAIPRDEPHAGRARKGEADSAPVSDIEMIAASGVFDRDYYLDTYPAVARAGVDPIVHYVKYGANEGRNPCALFDTSYYLRNNPDVVASGMNPLIHFCEFGWIQLRDPSSSFSTGWYFLVHLDGHQYAGNPLKHYLATAPDLRLSPTPFTPIMPADRCALHAALSVVLGRSDTDAELCQRIGDYLSRLKLWSLAEQAYQHATGLHWTHPPYHQRLASVFIRQKKWWQAARALTIATDLDDAHADWFFQLGGAQEHMKRWQQAAAAYQSALAIDASRAEWHYRFGVVLHKDNKAPEAERAYADAIRLDESLGAKKYGIGIFHERHNLWDTASSAYTERLRNDPLDADLLYRLGMTYDRRYQWAEAEHAYENAISLKFNMPQWHFRLGFVRERQQDWANAASAYRGAIFLTEKHVPYWNYRLGYVLARSGRFNDACLAYIASRYGMEHMLELPSGNKEGYQAARQRANTTLLIGDVGSDAIAVQVDSDAARLFDESLKNYMHKGEGRLRDVLAQDATCAEHHYRLGECLEVQGKWADAGKAYAAAVARSERHRSNWYYRLGLALFNAGYAESASRAFVNCRVFQRPHGVSEKAASTSETNMLHMSYVEYHETLPVLNDVILYESFNGNALACNPFAIFKKLVDDPTYSNCTHVWVVNDKSRIPVQYRSMRNVIFVAKASDLYLRYLCTAKYLINNSGFPPYFVRKPEQKYLATWHGTPLKTLGKEQKYKFYDHKRTQRNFLQATHIISPNKHTTDILFDSYDIRGLYEGALAETGYPRIDLTVDTPAQRKAEIFARLGLSGERPVVLYAPTWRGTLDEVAFDVQRLDDDVAKLGARNCDILFRGHSLLERVIEKDPVQCTVVPSDIDTNELLSLVDVLITDYSSIFFDFLVSGKPVLYYIYDEEAYEEERGLYFPVTDMPGYHCRDIDQLCAALDRALAGEIPDPEHYARSRARYNNHDDGSATARVIDFFFDDVQTHVVDPGTKGRKNVLFNGGGLLPNGITTSFLNLVKHIDRRKHNVVIGFSPTGIEANPGAMAMFRRLPDDIAGVPRYGYVPMSLEERWVRIQYEACHGEPNEEQLGIIRNVFEREFTRIFGPASFEAAISFSGYDAFWASVMTLNRRDIRKSVYLHNDMYGEYVAKFPELERMFRLYQHADALASVSTQTNDLNRHNIASRFGISPAKFVSCDNVLDPEGILGLSEETLTEQDVALFDTEGPVFINMARLSVEKDHEKLLSAFAQFVKESPSARLLVLGTGPLRQHLDQLVVSLELTSNAHFLGYRGNPYPFLKAADCFVLSSNHEGQPMTLLEALVLNKPIVATDIVGNHSVLHGRPGLLVENSVQGVLQGLRSFAQEDVACGAFDWKAYQNEALSQFRSNVLGEMRANNGERAETRMRRCHPSMPGSAG